MVKDDFGRELYDAVCSSCGSPCQVPFKPIEGKPVYCRDCYRKRKKGGRRGGSNRW